MTPDSDTPRTDEFARTNLLVSGDARAIAYANFARELERQLAAETQHAADCSRAAEGYCNDLSDCIREKVDLESRLAEAERDAANCREFARKAAEILGAGRDTDDLIPFAHLYRLDGVCLKHETYRCEGCRAARAAIRGERE